MTQPCATISDVRVLDGYRIELTFSDGIQGVVDLANRIVRRAACSDRSKTRNSFGKLPSIKS